MRGKAGSATVWTVETLLDECEPEPNSGCWLWTGAVNGKSGYGATHHNRRSVTVHRLMYRLSTGADPGALYVCHKCDVKTCINPAHLFLGTHHDNMADRDAKGRCKPLKGEAHPKARLTADMVVRIREARARGETYAAIASRHGVATATIWCIVAGRNWKHTKQETTRPLVAR